MRWLVPFFLLGASCSGSSTDTTFVGPETCDNGVDDNGNGLVDCADTAFCGGLACQTGDDDDDDDTGTPLPPIEVIWTPQECCDFQITPECPKSIGTIGLANRTDQEAELDASCDLVDGESPIVWQIQGSGDPPQAFIVNEAIAAGASLTLEAFYNCAITHGFQTTCRVNLEVPDGGPDDDIEFDVTATPPQ